MDFYNNFRGTPKSHRSHRSDQVEFYDISNDRARSRSLRQDWNTSTQGSPEAPYMDPDHYRDQYHKQHNGTAGKYGRPQPKSAMRIRNPAAVYQDPYRRSPPVFEVPRSPVDWEPAGTYGAGSQARGPSPPPPAPQSTRSRGATLLRQRSLPPPTPYGLPPRGPMIPPPMSPQLRPAAMDKLEAGAPRPESRAGPSRSGPATFALHHPNPNPTKGAVRVSRVDAWTRFLAYEGCFQVCLKASSEGNKEAQHFMANGCELLKSALEVDQIVLDAAGSGLGEDYTATPVITWNDELNAPINVPPAEPQSIQYTPQYPPQPRSVTWGQDIALEQIRPMDVAPLSVRVKFRGFDAAEVEGFVKKAIRRSIKRNPKAVESMCVSHAESGPYFHVFLDSKRRSTSASHGGELIIPADQSEVLIHLFEDNTCVAIGRLPIPPPSGIAPTRAPVFRPYPLDDDNMGCLPFFHVPKRNKGYGASNQRRRSDRYSGDVGPITPVEVIYRKDGNRAGTMFMTVEEYYDEDAVQQEVRGPPTPAPHRPITPPTQLMVKETAAKANIRVSPYMSYDYLLDAAMKLQGCCSTKLKLDGPWKWLLEEFAALYKIRPGYTLITHLKWVMRHDIRTCTARCLELILEEYTNLLQEKDEMGLHEQDVATMNRIAKECKELLGTIFENYYSLTEMAESGIVEGSMHQPDCPPAALEPAIILLARLNNSQLTNDQVWLKERFKVAAKKKYQRLQCSCDEEMCPPTGRENTNNDQFQRPPSSRGGQFTPNASGYPQMHMQMQTQYQPQGAAPAEAAKLQQYKKVEALAMTLRNDLDYDMRIHESAVLPPFLNLPVVVAEVYCEELTGKLRGLLSQIPPEHPAVEAVDMVVSIGRLQEYLVRYKLLPSMEADSYLDATELFGNYVKEWIASAEMQLVARCMSLEAGSGNEMYQWGSPEGRSENGLSPMIVEMIKLLEDQLAKFERIVVYWHALGPFLEKAISSVVRASLAAVSKQCGMVYVTQHHNEPGYDGQHMGLLTPFGSAGSAGHRRSPPRSPLHQSQNRNGMWQWQPQMASRRHDLPELAANEAVLLNSLRRLLGEVAEYEQTLIKWCGLKEDYSKASTVEVEGAFSDGSMPPTVGAQFAQVVKELRTEYSNATVHCCRRLAKIILSQPANMVANILHSSRNPDEPEVNEKMDSLMQTLEQTIRHLHAILDSRVFVSLVRGLWEHLSEDIYIFVENLSEGRDYRGAWRSRQNAQTMLEAANIWFRDILARYMQHDVTGKDLELPIHASLTEKLLAENSSAANMTYTVF
ncbi:hypothetical protein BSKO_11558 [Bryopsis sp. KO-2023]|nr:hypothetical protein BSKO_11558 [Bryopsis sp. KO-2023]